MEGVREYITPLTELLSSIDSATDHLRQFPLLLRATKDFLVGVVYESVNQQLSELREKMDSTVTLVNEAMTRILLCQKEERTTQTDRRRSVAVAVETEMTVEHLAEAGLATLTGPLEAAAQAAAAEKSAAKGGAGKKGK
jgi:hypothetical protein